MRCIFITPASNQCPSERHTKPEDIPLCSHHALVVEALIASSAIPPLMNLKKVTLEIKSKEEDIEEEIDANETINT